MDSKKLQVKDQLEDTKSNFKIMFLFLGIFYTIAIALWVLTSSIFYLINFFIIGTSLGLGMGLWPVLSKRKKHVARKVSQVLVGGYMFFGLGFGLIYIFFGHIMPENMQFEGFWFWLFAGFWGAGVLHYSIAKIIGPFLFNRGWCAWACWTAALLDYLPWTKSPGRIRRLGILRYIHFLTSTLLIITLVFVFEYTLNNTAGIILLDGVHTDFPEQYEFLWQIPEFW